MRDLLLSSWTNLKKGVSLSCGFGGSQMAFSSFRDLIFALRRAERDGLRLGNICEGLSRVDWFGLSS